MRVYDKRKLSLTRRGLVTAELKPKPDCFLP